MYAVQGHYTYQKGRPELIRVLLPLGPLSGSRPNPTTPDAGGTYTQSHPRAPASRAAGDVVLRRLCSPRCSVAVPAASAQVELRRGIVVEFRMPPNSPCSRSPFCSTCRHFPYLIVETLRPETSGSQTTMEGSPRLPTSGRRGSEYFGTCVHYRARQRPPRRRLSRTIR